MKHQLTPKVLASVALATMTQWAVAAPLFGSDYSSRVTNIAFNVYDLAPADGIAAHYSISSLTNLYELSYSTAGTYHPYTETRTTAGSVTHGSGATRATGSWSGVFGELSASAHIDAPVSETYVTAKATQTIVITLSPHTAFVASGRSLLEGSNYGEWSSIYAQASMIMRLGPADGASKNQKLFSSYPTGLYDGEFNLINDFALGYTNTTDVARDITLSLELWADGSLKGPLVPAVTAPVPEPSTWLMLGAGLVALGATARRRAKPLR
ncbi:PEP-CTERM sorting domain-containing protein [[Empedobacter] haloabium]|uniref:PEP-CTERM sorting domain-containing protein n=1 Tax=[Empedobacter] haloabium TaxID=592317 RepID=A0ABZ1UGK7_9BURK